MQSSMRDGVQSSVRYSVRPDAMCTGVVTFGRTVCIAAGTADGKGIDRLGRNPGLGRTAGDTARRKCAAAQRSTVTPNGQPRWQRVAAGL